MCLWDVKNAHFVQVFLEALGHGLGYVANEIQHN